MQTHMKSIFAGVLTFAMSACAIKAQTAPAVTSASAIDAVGQKGPQVVSPLSQPTISPAILQLMELEGRFAQAVAAGGGKAFASWFAYDAVTLNNGQTAVLGRAAIAAKA